MTDQRDSDQNGNPTDLSITPLPEQPPMDDAAGGPQAADDEELYETLKVQGGE